MSALDRRLAKLEELAPTGKKAQGFIVFEGVSSSQQAGSYQYLYQPGAGDSLSSEEWESLEDFQERIRAECGPEAGGIIFGLSTRN